MGFFSWLFGGREGHGHQPLPSGEPRQSLPAKESRSFFSTEIFDEGRELASEKLARLTQLAIPKSILDIHKCDLAPGLDSKQLQRFAQDDIDGGNGLKATFNINQCGVPEPQAFWYAGQGFIGYQLCAIIAQHWLVNKACFIPAGDALRNGYKFTINDGTNINGIDAIDRIEKANVRYKLDQNLKEFIGMGRTFGVRIVLFKVDNDDPEYYVKPFNPDSVGEGKYRGMVQIDPYWAVPELSSAAASDPTLPGFYEPTYWIVGSKRIHRSHLVIMRGPEVADILKPSYLFGGISVPQRIYERVYAAERTANEAPMLALTKRSTNWYTDTAKILANETQFMGQLNKWISWRDNYGVKIADKEADRIEQMDTSLADLDAVIMTQYQIVASAANVPVTKLMGTVPKGFNSSGDYEADSYHEELENIQANDMQPLMNRHLECLIRSDIAPAMGVNPFSVTCTWEPVKSLSAKEIAEINKMKAETDKINAVDIGAVDSEEVREKLSADEHSGYNGLPMIEDEPETPAPPVAPAQAV